MTVDQAQELRNRVIALRDDMGIPVGEIALEVRLDLPVAASALVVPTDVELDVHGPDHIGLRMPV